MTLAVLVLQGLLPPGHSLASSMLRLVGGIATGGVGYGISLFVLWRLAGKPEGAERQLLDLIAAVGRRIVIWRARVSGSSVLTERHRHLARGTAVPLARRNRAGTRGAAQGLRSVAPTIFFAMLQRWTSLGPS